MRKVFLCLLIFCFNSSFVFAQSNKSDSLLNIFKTAKSDTVKIRALLGLCRYAWKQGHYDKGLEYANQTLDIIGKLKETRTILKDKAYALANIAIIYEEQGKYAEGLKSGLAGLKIFEDVADKEGQAASYNTIGNIYWGELNYPEALRNHFTALNMRKDLMHEAEQKGDSDKAKIYRSEMSYSYANIGGLYDECGKYDSARISQLASLAIKEELKDTEGIATSYNNLGNIADHLKDYPEAIKSYSQCLAMALRLNAPEIITISYLNIGIIQIKTHKFPEARKSLEEGLQLAKKMGSKYYAQGSYQALAQLDSTAGDYKGAYENYIMYVTYRDSLNNEANTKKTVQEQMNYEFDKKEASQKAEQEKKDAVSAAEKNKQQVIIYSVSAGLLLMLVLAGLILRGYSQKRKANALLEEKNKTIQEQKAVVEHQKAIVEEKNKDITDSIHYASRIQRALLTSEEYIGKYVKEYFILFKPRDIVSGDFYWAFNADDKFYIACCDCTGHGVPGAFMSLLNISMLNESIIERKIASPDKVLNDIRSNIIKSLNPEGKDEGSKDGMDCILCSIDFKANMLQAACANNPVCIVKKDGSVKEINPDKMPVGIQHGEEKPFTLHTEKLEAGDTLYLFTDGYADQFGGPKGKKFKYKQLEEKLQSIASLSMDKQKEELNNTIENWKGNLEQVDDILIIGIRV